MDFGWFNWTLTGLAIAGILGLSLYCRRYIRDVADFLSAGRVAGRYVICVGSMEEALGIIALVQMMERNYLCGFAIAFWNITTVALNMVINLSGWCTYRFRETRAMSFGQVLEIRYNRAIRIVCTSTGVSESEAEEALKRCGFSCKTAIVMLLLKVEAPEAKRLLAAADGRIARAVENGHP